MSAVTTERTTLPQPVVNDMGPLIHLCASPDDRVALCGHVPRGDVQAFELAGDERTCVECERVWEATA